MTSETALRTTAEVAHRLTKLCREGKHAEAINELYAENIRSHEPARLQGPALTEGKAYVIQKTIQWGEHVQEIHHAEVSEPLVAANHFSLTYKMDISPNQGERYQMEEIAVYEVNDGAITTERFYYPTA